MPTITSTPINAARHHDVGRRSASISYRLPGPAISTTKPSVIAFETTPTKDRPVAIAKVLRQADTLPDNEGDQCRHAHESRPGRQSPV